MFTIKQNTFKATHKQSFQQSSAKLQCYLCKSKLLIKKHPNLQIKICYKLFKTVKCL